MVSESKRVPEFMRRRTLHNVLENIAFLRDVCIEILMVELN